MSNQIRFSLVAAASFMALVLIALFATQASPTAASPDGTVKIGVIDTGKIVESSATGRNARASLEQFQTQAEAEGLRQQAEIKDLQAKISNGQQSLPENQLAQLKKQLEEKMTAFRRWQDDTNREGKKKQEAILADFERKAMPLINQIGKEMGYTAIFRKFESGLIYVDQATDITAMVIQRLDTGATTSSIDTSANRNVGAGTASPSGRLDLSSSSKNGTSMFFQNTDTGGKNWRFLSTGTTNTGGAGIFGLVNSTDDPSNYKVMVTPSGLVGIGTASPTDRLSVYTTKTSTSTATPDSINLGGTFSNSAGTNLKLKLYDDGSNVGGFGISNSRMDYRVWSSDVDHVFYQGVSELMRIRGNGRVGIGTPSPDQLLSVNGDASKTGGNTWLSFSDERLKNIRGRFNSGLKAVMQLQPIRYEYKRDNALGLKSEGEHIGFGAQALQKIIPEAVTKNSTGYLMVNSDPIMWTMLNAIKEQQKEIAELKGQVWKLPAASRRRRN